MTFQYQQLANHLRQDILAGHLLEGQKLQSLRAFATVTR